MSHNWVETAEAASTAVCGAVGVGFTGTKNVTLQVDTSRIALPEPTRYPILAWTVNGGPVQTHQLVAGETSVPRCTDAADPVIALYVNGMCPRINRYEGDPPPNAFTMPSFAVDKGSATIAVKQPRGIWLSIGDSITSGDERHSGRSQTTAGRPREDAEARHADRPKDEHRQPAR